MMATLTRQLISTAIMLGAAAAAASGQNAAADPVTHDTYTLVHCGHLLAIPGKAAQENVTLVIKNDRVDAVSPGFNGPDLAAAKASGAAVTEIDLKHSFVLPGLIDCHVHLTNTWDRSFRSRLMTETPEFVAIRATLFARQTLEASFTTVRDLGANSPESIFALRDAVEQGIVVGPRIIAAGHWIAMTGGHDDSTLGFRADVVPRPTPDDDIADGPDECVKTARNQIKLGADVIKVTATGGVLSSSSRAVRKNERP